MLIKNAPAQVLPIKNASQLPKRYLGLHMLPGCAEYREPGMDPYRIFINADTIRKMDKSFEGRPVYVKHVDDVDLTKIEEVDGWVTKSFYNALDGKHWVEFMIVSDKGHDAIAKGWRLSNAYVPKFGTSRGGGVWNGIDYQKEVVDGTYDHLALVPNPRYDESIILTPDQFKEYNLRKESDLKIANSKGDKQMSLLKLFKREKIENTLDVENTLVVLPVSKKEMTVLELATEMDKIVNMQGYCNMDHMVKVGEEEMSVGKLVKDHMKMKESMQNMEEKDGGEKDAIKEEDKADKTKNKKKNMDEKDGGEKDAVKEEKKSDKTKNELSPEEKAKEEQRVKDEEAEKVKNANLLLEAAAKAHQNGEVIETSEDRVRRGKERYGKMPAKK